MSIQQSTAGLLGRQCGRLSKRANNGGSSWGDWIAAPGISAAKKLVNWGSSGAGALAGEFGVGPDTIKNKITQRVQDKLKGGGGYQWGQQVVKNLGGSGGQTNTLPGQIGSAIAKELPDAPNLDTIPRIFMGFQQGGFGSGMSQIGQALQRGVGGLFKTSAQNGLDLPPQLARNIGEAFQGSNSAMHAANLVAPAVNKTFDHLLQNSVFGKGLKMVTDPMSYIGERAKEFGLGSPFAGNEGGKSGGPTP